MSKKIVLLSIFMVSAAAITTAEAKEGMHFDITAKFSVDAVKSDAKTERRSTASNAVLRSAFDPMKNTENAFGIGIGAFWGHGLLFYGASFDMTFGKGEYTRKGKTSNSMSLETKTGSGGGVYAVLGMAGDKLPLFGIAPYVKAGLGFRTITSYAWTNNPDTKQGGSKTGTGFSWSIGLKTHMMGMLKLFAEYTQSNYGSVSQNIMGFGNDKLQITEKPTSSAFIIGAGVAL